MNFQTPATVNFPAPNTVTLGGGSLVFNGEAPKIGDVVRVTWGDAWFDLDDSTEDQFKDSCPIVTLGTLVRNGPVVSVAAESGGGYWRATTHIPAAIVLSIEVVERASA